MFRHRGAALSRAPARRDQYPNAELHHCDYPDHELCQDDPLARRTSGAYMLVAASRGTFAPVMAKSAYPAGYRGRRR
jgi:hypothetical protein